MRKIRIQSFILAPYVIVAALLLLTSYVRAQDILVDSKGKDVLLSYQTGSTQFKLASGDPSLQLTLSKKIRRTRFYFDSNPNGKLDEKDDTTVIKGYSFSFTGKLLSTDNYLFLSNLGKLRPGFKFELGLQNTLDSVINLKALEDNNIGTKFWGINVYTQWDNSRIYDTITSTESKFHPWTVGAKFHFSYLRKRWILISTSLALERTWNEDNLLRYQSNKPRFENAQVIALDDFIGFIGKREMIWRARLRLSAPIMPFSKTCLSNFALAPYYIMNLNFGAGNSQIYGFSINYFGNKFNGKRFNFSEAFGVGFDWTRIKNRGTGFNMFVFGSLNLGALFQLDERENEKEKKRR